MPPRLGNVGQETKRDENESTQTLTNFVESYLNLKDPYSISTAPILLPFFTNHAVMLESLQSKKKLVRLYDAVKVSLFVYTLYIAWPENEQNYSDDRSRIMQHLDSRATAMTVVLSALFKQWAYKTSTQTS